MGRSMTPRTLFFFVCLFYMSCGSGKKYIAETNVHRLRYKTSFLQNERSPLTASDTSFLDFYQPDQRWVKKAVFTPSNKDNVIEIPTYSGIKKPYRLYGTVTFKDDKKSYVLEVYKSAQMPENPLYKNHLFLPFKDETNGDETYGGGRYMDLTVSDIKNNKITLDFNKCYNPWCAYSDGYNCPVPPKSNHLPIRVPAGEKMFTGSYKHK